MSNTLTEIQPITTMLPFSQTGNAGSTLSHVVIPAGGRDRVRVQYANATSDKAASLLTFKSESKSTTVTATSAATQTVINAPPYSQFLIPAENELALVGGADEFVNHPRMGFRVAAVPMRCHLLLLLDH
ncbi:MAG: hypothetical protein NTW21_35150 [Verrucomicrobia bacterium]|nr:hypothetical protein [Verrucomicrobiota bacterium]